MPLRRLLHITARARSVPTDRVDGGPHARGRATIVRWILSVSCGVVGASRVCAISEMPE